MKETGEGGIEVRLEGLKMFGVTVDDQVCEGVDHNGGVSEVVQGVSEVVQEDGLIPETEGPVGGWTMVQFISVYYNE